MRVRSLRFRRGLSPRTRKKPPGEAAPGTGCFAGVAGLSRATLRRSRRSAPAARPRDTPANALPGAAAFPRGASAGQLTPSGYGRTLGNKYSCRSSPSEPAFDVQRPFWGGGNCPVGSCGEESPPAASEEPGRQGRKRRTQVSPAGERPGTAGPASTRAAGGAAPGPSRLPDGLGGREGARAGAAAGRPHPGTCAGWRVGTARPGGLKITRRAR